ncbi:MAG: CHAD domain-containing protein [Acidobacteriota bacterium]|nr:CHAD domain-containing protein [Acidobacteriota bacterium]
MDQLSGENLGDLGVAIHESRKSVKKIRSVLRLFRAELGDTYASQNSKRQAAGRKLSGLRDAAVMVEVFDKLNHKYPDELSKRTVDKIRGRLAARKNQAYKEAKNGNLLTEVRTALHACMKSVKRWPLQLDGFPAIAPGIETTFRRARMAMKYARKHQEPENFHEWRKRVKDHWYQTRLLSNLIGHSIRAQKKNLKKLETWLGDDHNLAVLRQKMIGQPGLESLIDRYQTELRGSALALGERIYGEQPRQFTRRMKHLWGG